MSSYEPWDSPNPYGVEAPIPRNHNCDVCEGTTCDCDDGEQPDLTLDDVIARAAQLDDEPFDPEPGPADDRD